MDYQLHIKNDSMFNTPSTFAVYVNLLVLEWIQAQGGLQALGKRNAPDSDDLPSLVFSSEGIREHFPQVQALAELAQTQRYHVRAFRSPESSVAPDLSIDDFGIGIGDFLLNTSDVAIALNEWRMLPALEIAFTRPIPTDMCDHAQNIAIIMLDHIIGEWAASVKIGMVDFGDAVPCVVQGLV